MGFWLSKSASRLPAVPQAMHALVKHTSGQGQKQLQVCGGRGGRSLLTAWYSAVSPTRKQMVLVVMESSFQVDLVAVSSLADNNRLKQRVMHANSS